MKAKPKQQSHRLSDVLPLNVSKVLGHKELSVNRQTQKQCKQVLIFDYMYCTEWEKYKQNKQTNKQKKPPADTYMAFTTDRVLSVSYTELMSSHQLPPPVTVLPLEKRKLKHKKFQ